MIKAPYNFVPLSDKVFYPPWAEQVSHDIPFSDGESGEIDITITAKSPIFIRDGKNKEEFCHHVDKSGKKTYYIPGSSVKGMVRNVLEIMSFSKMKFVDDKTYAVRDLRYDTYMNKIKSGLQCGWLYKEGNDYKIEDCGEPFRVRYDEIGRYFDINFKENFLIQNAALNKMGFDKLYKKLDKKNISESIKNEYIEIQNSDQDRQIKYKNKLKSKIATGSFDESNSPYKNAFKKYSLISENLHTTVYNFSEHYEDSFGRKIVNFEENGPNEGHLVLTGHPSARVENIDPNDDYKIKGTGKIFDFVFVKKENSSSLHVSEEVLNNFKFAYFDGRTTQPKESDDWSFWKDKLKNGGRVPVFFHKNYQGVASFGLSYLYKFPYENSIKNALLDEHINDEIDMAESIFGFTRKIENKLSALKGRVQFSHGRKKVNTTMQESTSRYVLLGTPKASYYPIYIVQNGNGYKTLMDGNAVLSGWKRYPTHAKFSHTCAGKSSQTSNIAPLASGATFSMKIRVHNLKSEELGALLSALTFHNASECYHTLGMAKPYGYGKVSLDVETMKGFAYTKEHYMKSFEASVNAEVFDDKIEWHNCEQIKNLFSMAKEQNDNNLMYMKLRDFADKKNNNNYLGRYISLDGVNILSATSLVSQNDITNYKSKVKHLNLINEERKITKAKKKAELTAVMEAEQASENQWFKISNSKNIIDLNNYIRKYPKSKYFDEAKQKLEMLNVEEAKARAADMEKEAKSKWESVKKSDKKYRKKALEDYIEKYKDSIYVNDAKKELEIYASEDKPKLDADIKTLASATNGKIFKNILDRLTISDADKSAIAEYAVDAYVEMDKKRQKNFFREAQLGRFIGKDLENKVKKRLED